MTWLARFIFPATRDIIFVVGLGFAHWYAVRNWLSLQKQKGGPWWSFVTFGSVLPSIKHLSFDALTRVGGGCFFYKLGKEVPIQKAEQC